MCHNECSTNSLPNLKLLLERGKRRPLIDSADSNWKFFANLPHDINQIVYIRQTFLISPHTMLQGQHLAHQPPIQVVPKRNPKRNKNF